jgi:GalNAc-alpha-(1->4)-GalNAc-alpha-(1->3)-diNAcBac-PP-undecaprenol alpha-1,4-N-acetyl-D-galactosaminyltransferase
MRITLVIASLAGGGAERVVTTLTRGFINAGQIISVITLFGRETDFFALPDGAQRLALGLGQNSRTIGQAIRNNARRAQALRRAIRSTAPDVVISFVDQTNILVLLSLWGTSIPVLVTEHNASSADCGGKLWEMLRRCVYPFATALVSVSEGVDRQFRWMPKKKRWVIYNPLAYGDSGSAGDSPLPTTFSNTQRHLIAMGRLAQQKGFDLLIDAFARIADAHSDWDLHILGEGEKRAELTALISKLNLEKRVFLTGRIPHPFPILRHADLFVLSSRWEGFAIVLIEAMACGLPVLSFDCLSGPREIIRHQTDGLLVPAEDVGGLAEAMDHLMSDEKERRRLASNTQEGSQRFGIDGVIAQWQNLLDRVIKKNRSG